MKSTNCNIFTLLKFMMDSIIYHQCKQSKHISQFRRAPTPISYHQNSFYLYKSYVLDLLTISHINNNQFVDSSASKYFLVHHLILSKVDYLNNTIIISLSRCSYVIARKRLVDLSLSTDQIKSLQNVYYILGLYKNK